MKNIFLAIMLIAGLVSDIIGIATSESKSAIIFFSIFLGNILTTIIICFFKYLNEEPPY